LNRRSCYKPPSRTSTVFPARFRLDYGTVLHTGFDALLVSDADVASR
jgi:hypothetical protein